MEGHRQGRVTAYVVYFLRYTQPSYFAPRLGDPCCTETLARQCGSSETS